jgi:molybdopterin-guanine dinucleotide biosynthesis protein A
MGTDKALLELGGKPLIEHAVTKLRRITSGVNILSGAEGSHAAFAQYAPLIPDLHPGCGPMGGMEAALTRSRLDWNLFLAVDLPFLPAEFIHAWTTHWMQSPDDGARIRIFSDGGRPHPAFCLLHKDVLPFLSEAIRKGDLKLMRVFEVAGRELALRRGYPPEAGFWNEPAAGMPSARPNEGIGDRRCISPAQQAARPLWFANLNTPEDFALAESQIDALDT